MFVDGGDALHGVGVGCLLRIGVEVTERRQRERPPLGAVVQIRLHQHDRRTGCTGGAVHRGRLDRGEIPEARGGERAEHLQLVRWAGLHAAHVLDERAVAEDERRVALLHAQDAHGRFRIGFERVGVGTLEAERRTRRLQRAAPAHRRPQPLHVLRIAQRVVQESAVVGQPGRDHEIGRAFRQRITDSA